MEGEDTLPQRGHEGTGDVPSIPLEERIAQESARAKLFGAAAQPQRLDRYFVIEVLGAGAMGTVYAAYDPKLDRRVALKLVRGQSRQHDARLIREAQGLAQVSHPNIVQVYDVGSVRLGAQGVVFIAMELVQGPTLRGWLEAKVRSLEEIVDVFAGVGQGLAAAHRSGLVHRDFKPDNVLVGDDGRPRVLDFGLVRRGERDPSVEVSIPDDGVASTGVDRLTRSGTIMGTPAYMAPEQHEGAAVDARSDQFSFCVALHEALHGERPFAGDTLPELAANVIEGRRATPRAERTLPGRLRAAIDRGLAKDPAERFETMDALLVELRRPSRWRPAAAVLGVAGAGAIGFAAMGDDATPCGALDDPIAAVWNDGRRASLRETFVASNLGFAERTASDVGTSLDAYAAAWSASQVDACRQTRVEQTQSEQLLDLRMACLKRRRGELAALLDVLDTADEPVVTRAAELVASLTPPSRCDDTERLLAAVAPPDDAIADDVAAQEQRLAEGRTLYHAGKLSEAMPVFEDVVQRARELGYEPLLASALAHLANASEGARDLEAAEALGIEAFQVALASGADASLALAASNLVSTIGGEQRRYAEAEVWLGHAKAATRRVEDDPVAVIRLQHREATLDYYQDRFEAAAELLRRTCELAEVEVGADHPQTMKCTRNLAMVLNRLGRVEEATALTQESLERTIALLGPDHPDVGNVYMNLGIFAAAAGEPQASLQHNREALRVFEAAYGPDSSHVADVLTNLGNRYRETGDHEEALQSYERALRIVEHVHGPDNLRLSSFLNNVALALQNLGRFDEALLHYERASALAEQAEGPERQGVGIAHNNIGNILMELQRPKEAIPHYEQSRDVLETVLGPDHLFVASPLAGLGDAWVAVGRPKDAVPAYERALEIRDAHHDPEAADVREALADARAAARDG